MPALRVQIAQVNSAKKKPTLEGKWKGEWKGKSGVYQFKIPPEKKKLSRKHRVRLALVDHFKDAVGAACWEKAEELGLDKEKAQEAGKETAAARRSLLIDLFGRSPRTTASSHHQNAGAAGRRGPP